jgi:hypothetical protein
MGQDFYLPWRFIKSCGVPFAIGHANIGFSAPLRIVVPQAQPVGLAIA